MGVESAWAVATRVIWAGMNRCIMATSHRGWIAGIVEHDEKRGWAGRRLIPTSAWLVKFVNELRGLLSVRRWVPSVALAGGFRVGNQGGCEFPSEQNSSLRKVGLL